MDAKQADRATIDISERLRLLMVTHHLSVVDLARAAGVSKSAMEKYLAGPSSPRAISIVSLCRVLGVHSEWLLFGKPDEEVFNIRRSAIYVIGKLLRQLKQGGPLRTRFDGEEVDSKEFEGWAFEVSDACSLEIAAFFASDRKKALADAAAGLRISQLDPVKF